MVTPHDPHPTPDADESRIETQDEVVAETLSAAAEQEAAVLEGPRDVPRPIGPERLRALRARIEGGEYPSPDDVAGGLFEMFGRTD